MEGESSTVWNQQVTQPQFVPQTTAVYTATTSQQAYTSNQQHVSTNFPQAQYIDTHYHHMRPQFATYHINLPQGDIYQPAHSTYERISPVEEYRDVPSGSDTITTYSTIQAADGAQLIAAPSVDSTTLQHAGIQVHHVMLDAEHRVVAVQRVVSPVDCTVSQSTLSIHREQEAQASSLLPVISSGQQLFTAAHVSSMLPKSDVSTSADSPGQHHGQVRNDHETDQAVSSITVSLPESMITAVSQRMETLSGEPDTTQEDSQDFHHHNQVDSQAFSNGHADLADANGLHSTMTGGAGISTTTGDVIEAAMSSAQLSSTHDESIDTTDAELNHRVVDSSAGEHLVNPALTNGISMDEEDSSMDSSSSSSSMDDDKENALLENRQLRKSNRIANMEAESSCWLRPQYQSKPYSPEELWCEECLMSYATECPAHRLQIVPDKVVLSRAWSSLPPMLQIFRLGESTELGVFAKRNISKLTQFGPFIGELVDSRERLTNTKFPLLLERLSGEHFYFETSDENKCNWMMFIRSADNFAEQNLVAYQHGQDIYFTVSKNIEAKQELKVWYAAHYAERLGVGVLDITDEDLEAMDEQECKWSCYECNKRFKTSSALQKHLIIHEENISSRAEDDDFDARKENALRKHKRKGIPLRAKGLYKRRGRQPKYTATGADGMPYQWKKKSSTFYINKTLKKYQRRHDPEAIRRTIKSLYRKKGKETGGNEWVCTHCDLTFDNSNLLNLHTLTHAAEDVGLDEVKKLVCDPAEKPINKLTESEASIEEGDSIITLQTCMLACPVCRMPFSNQRDLIQHASEHGKTKRKLMINPDRPYKCDKCWKAFGSQERLQKHLLCHGDENSKPLQCQVCFKRFMNNSALSCHMKTHSDKKYYECPICHLGFDQVSALKAHVVLHAENGKYTCRECRKEFEDFIMIRKHMRAFHSEKKYPCSECDKIFPRPDKLKLHMLRHSTHREFMCENCGRQFKRKDKLKEHIKRMHSAEREAKLANREEKPPGHKKFVPKVSPTDYHRFIYKCHTCLLGFKRRGMLVNHLAKRHPDIKPDSVPELNLPILKTQRDYYCQYCEKVYKSSSKRKAHILKNHPGSELPMSSRKKSLIPDIPGLPNPTYSQTVGSITTMPHSCSFCHKQYASKAKLMQHQRKKHPEMVPPAPCRRLKYEKSIHSQVLSEDSTAGQSVDEQFVQEAQQQSHADSYQAADLLTQAMSELTCPDYRQTVNDFSARVAHAGQTMVQIQAPAETAPHGCTTIELSHLGQTLAHTQFTTQQTLTVTQPQPAQVPQPALSPQPVSIATTLTQPVPVSLATGHTTFTIPRTWPNYANFR